MIPRADPSRTLRVLQRRSMRAELLALALVAACGTVLGCAPAPGGSVAPAPTPVFGGVELTVATGAGHELRFTPPDVVAPSGVVIQLTFVNESAETHNLVFQDGVGAATRLDVGPGESDVVRFDAPGPGAYRFTCTIHPNMSGTLTVT